MTRERKKLAPVYVLVVAFQRILHELTERSFAPVFGGVIRTS